MRVACPNCDAIYEVPADAIPDEGRDVQCSNCESSWFQTPLGPPAEAEGSPAARPSARLSSEDADLLREEAARELTLRSATPVEPPPPAEDEAPPAPPPPPPRQIGDPVPPEEAAEDEAPKTFARAPSRRDRLPDIEEINTSLGPREDGAEGGEPEAQRARRRSFRLGFSGSLLVATALVGLYVSAPRIAAEVPALAEPIRGYEEGVNRLRLRLDQMTRRAAAGLAAEGSDG